MVRNSAGARALSVSPATILPDATKVSRQIREPARRTPVPQSIRYLRRHVADIPPQPKAVVRSPLLLRAYQKQKAPTSPAPAIRPRPSRRAKSSPETARIFRARLWQSPVSQISISASVPTSLQLVRRPILLRHHFGTIYKGYVRPRQSRVPLACFGRRRVFLASAPNLPASGGIIIDDPNSRAGFTRSARGLRNSRRPRAN